MKALAIFILATSAIAADWKPAPGKLMTRWAKDVNPDAPLPEYPRPQMVRKEWVNLNGLWDYAIAPKDAPQPTKWDGQILVPFCIESALSGVGKTVGEDNRLWYRLRTDKLAPRDGKRWLLNFGAVDWHAIVFVNGKQVGEHKGGYDPFSFDVTDALKKDGPQEIVISVWDPSDASWIPRGKQVRKPQSIWYTSVTGIWQTVWAEPVPEKHIERLTIHPIPDAQAVDVEMRLSGLLGVDEINVKVLDSAGVTSSVTRSSERKAPPNEAQKGLSTLESFRISLQGAKLWTPEQPQIYRFSVATKETGDEIESYFALRNISLGKDENGITRIFLNGKPYFHFGPLDQGWWPDGLYTAPTDEALKFDIEMTKRCGMNMARKHVKVEPARWYYWCDKLGLLVWQDMPSGDKFIGTRDPDITRSAESAANFENEWREIINDFRHFSCIIVWVPFNEGWGQFDTARIVDFTKNLDSTRLVNCASGWTDRPGVGDVHDMHKYPGPGMYPPEDKRASVLGEFGGLGLPVEGHTWLQKGNWGYRSFTDKESLAKAYEDLIRRLRPLVWQGLSAAIYTQTTDVEIEVNGLMTYDRAVEKWPASSLELTKKLYEKPGRVQTLLPTAQDQPNEWSWTTEKPADGWAKPDFDASGWKKGPAGFGEKSTPGSVVRTDWKSADIWLRREFTLPEEKLTDSHLLIHYDEDPEVFLNGIPVFSTKGYTTAYTLTAMPGEALKILHPGKNVIAIHAHNAGGGQYIDAGLVDLVPAK
jgi:Glycosyl hydrolases family 2, sugar binding domain/Glycosyl hydrolases family 2, TIM barrel domain/Glycosyl hydrolases family 2